MPKPRALLAPLAGLTLLIALTDCAGADATQCANDSECENILGVSAAQAVCRSGVCALSITTPGGADAGAAARPSCTTNKECVATLGQAAVCRAEQCIPVLTESVTDVSGNLESDDPVFLGFVAPLTTEGGFKSASDQTYFDGVKLAVQDWDVGSGGGINMPGSPKRRPIAAVFCDSKLDADVVKSCVAHMANVLAAPAIVFRSSRDATAGLPLAHQAKALVYCSDCEPTDVPAPVGTGLLWFGAPALSDQIPIRVLWIERIEQTIRSKRSAPTANAPIKVAYLSSAQHVGHATEFKAALRFNGTTGDANEKLGNLVWKNISRTGFDWHALGKELAAFAPDIIVTSELGTDFHFYVVPEVEAQWPTSKAPRPHYVASEDESFENRLKRTIGGNEALRKRLTGVWSAAPSIEVIDNEELFFESAFAAKYGYPANGVATGFESFYALSFGLSAAIAGAQTSRLTGPDLAVALEQLVGGAPENILDFKASEIPRGISILQSGKKVDARGVYSDLEWDPLSGIIHGGAGIWCPSREVDGSIKSQELWASFDPNAPPDGEPDPGVCNY